MTHRELLLQLMGIAGVSAQENNVIAACENYLGMLSETTALGSGVFRISAGSGPHIVLNAHMDNIGFVITHIADGFAQIGTVGGIDARLLPATVLKNTRTDSHGVVCATPPHLSKGESKVIPTDECFVDLLGNSDVLVGDRYVFSAMPIMRGDRVMGPNLDDRAGIAAVIMAAEKIMAGGFSGTLTLLLSSMEETGEQGAATGAFAIAPDICICVDVSFGYRSGLKRQQCGNVGDGPMIGIAPSLQAAISQKLIRTAEENQIPHQREIMSGATGTDADKIGISAGGVAVGLVSIPLFEMHTPRESIDFSDVTHTAELIAAYVLGGVQE